MNRRDFLTLGAKAGIIILGAPAIVRAESLMKIWVPEKKIITALDWVYDTRTHTPTYIGETKPLRELQRDWMIWNVYYNMKKPMNRFNVMKPMENIPTYLTPLRSRQDWEAIMN